MMQSAIEKINPNIIAQKIKAELILPVRFLKDLISTDTSALVGFFTITIGDTPNRLEKQKTCLHSFKMLLHIDTPHTTYRIKIYRFKLAVI
jgi:hypothetical protein